MTDTFNLDRFLTAQERDYAAALSELGTGFKASHWIWYIFPQHVDLGRSATARLYGIASLQEAAAYFHHPVLGARLIEATEAALASGVTDPTALFGSPDDLKVRSCLTLFLEVEPGEETLARALTTFYGGRRDEKTLDLLYPDRVAEGDGDDDGPSAQLTEKARHSDQKAGNPSHEANGSEATLKS
ncbi:DUF1810 domain-containing protein [Acuticoccus sediminis]|uniref:DUF1810 domain-containing protein n=1 Tax=Acuticoccus sediminis TaxID=2184697 RepID=A0A8B2NNK7_9HYPH|nr:DUF1810 domain-containing protein [Acuticoccus sediminis]RAH99457.1 DUF1810 domain-containing protein [Acuticoccus sediminis]